MPLTPTNYPPSQKGKSTSFATTSSSSPTLQTNNYSTDGNISPQRNVQTTLQSFSSEGWRSSTNSPLLPTTMPAATAHSLRQRTISPLSSNQLSPASSRSSTGSSMSTARTAVNNDDNESDDDRLLAPIFPTTSRKKGWPGTFAMLTKSGDLNVKGLELAAMILAAAKKATYKNSLARGKKKEMVRE